MPLTEKDELTIEKSPNYVDILSPQRIHRLKPNPKKINLAVLIVRNPTVRAISDNPQHVAQNVNRTSLVLKS